MIRNWLKKIIQEALAEFSTKKFTIVANRDPTEQDIYYLPGSKWKNENEKWILKAKWERELDVISIKCENPEGK